MIFDTHTHYDDKSYDQDRRDVLSGLSKKGVGRICNVGSTFNGATTSVSLSRQYDFIYAAIGIHPDEVYDFYLNKNKTMEADVFFPSHDISSLGINCETRTHEIPMAENITYENTTLKQSDFEEKTSNPVFNELSRLAAEKKVVAIGEIGLDYHGFQTYESKPGKDIQKYWFKAQLELAIKLDLPAVIHSRNASQDTIEMMTQAHKDGLKCADIHCFSYSREVALKYLDMGFYLGFGGIITYEGEKKLIKVLEATPCDRILLETDCPYLIPDPLKTMGQNLRNSSEYLKYVVKKIAMVKGISCDEVEKISWDNANRFYGITAT